MGRGARGWGAACWALGGEGSALLGNGAPRRCPEAPAASRSVGRCGGCWRPVTKYMGSRVLRQRGMICQVSLKHSLALLSAAALWFSFCVFSFRFTESLQESSRRFSGSVRGIEAFVRLLVLPVCLVQACSQFSMLIGF